MSTDNTIAGSSIVAILTGQPLHVMYEESKSVGVRNLNPLLRSGLGGSANPYPAIPGATCDVVFPLNSEQTWVEAKLMQTHNGGNQDNWRCEDRSRNFEKHLGLIASTHHSAVRDVRDRLSTLDGYVCADRIGFLMVAYDSPRHPMDVHIAAFERTGALSDWSKDLLLDYPDPRPRAQLENARIKVYYWERATRHAR